MRVSHQHILTWIVVVCFAFLQALAPFIHGHIATQASLQGHGLHMHAEDIAIGHDQQVESHQHVYQHTLTGEVEKLYVVGVDKALSKDMDEAILPLFACLLAIIAWHFSPVVAFRFLVFSRRFSLSHCYFLPAPRAPPQGI